MQTGVVQTARDRSRPWVATLLIVGSIVAEAVMLFGGF